MAVDNLQMGFRYPESNHSKSTVRVTQKGNSKLETPPMEGQWNKQ